MSKLWREKHDSPKYFAFEASPNDMVPSVIMYDNYQERKRHSLCSKASLFLHSIVSTCIKLPYLHLEKTRKSQTDLVRVNEKDI